MAAVNAAHWIVPVMRVPSGAAASIVKVPPFPEGASEIVPDPRVGPDWPAFTVMIECERPPASTASVIMSPVPFVGRHIASALERTRLIDETRQRNAELSLINDVQRGLAMNLDMQAMYDLVGDRLQEIFDAQVVDIGVLDEAAALIHFPYTIEKGISMSPTRRV